MEKANITGNHYLTDGRMFVIFDKALVSLGDEGWGLPLSEDGAVAIAAKVIPYSSNIESVIQADRAAGREELIDHILIDPGIAINLVGEGKITADTLRDAQETEDSIILEGIVFEGTPRKVVIKAQEQLPEDFRFATIDANGEVV